ncbi:hypothetical protein A943_07955 [Bacillus sp. CPSM8]|nr:hypothetical protein A943_07955 [Bacillus sp. CPSM8]
MDMVEFLERYLGVRFTEWQKDYIRRMKRRTNN